MLAATLMSLALTTPALCDDEHETPECAAQLIAEATANLSLPPIQAEAEAGAQIYRAVFDGGQYGSPAVSFERRRGRPPELVIYGAGGAALRRDISTEVWDEVRERSRYVGRKLEAPAYQSSCLVSSDVVVQIAKPSTTRPDRKAELYDFRLGDPVIEAAQNSCNGGLTWDYGAWLADLACDEVAECAAMGSHEDFMLAVQNLGSVFLLQGDTVAAATLLAAKQEPPSSTARDIPVEAAAFDRWLNADSGATLVWAGRAPVTEGYPGGEIAAALAGLDAEMKDLGLVPMAFGAESDEVGWIEGVIKHDPDVDGVWRPSTAEYRQTWVRNWGTWKLWSMTVGPFTAPVSDD